MAKSLLVIENTQGQVVRTIHSEHESVLVYVNHDTGRVETAADRSLLDDVDFQFTILAEVQRSALERHPLALGQAGVIKAVQHVDNVVELVQFESENSEELKKISKWTAISHGAFLLLLLIGSFLMGKRQVETEPMVVQVFKQQLPTESKKTLRAAEQRIDRQKQIRAKVSDRTVKAKSTQTAQKTRSRLRTQVSVSKVGALGALGGMKSGLKGSAGFNINATNSSLGTSRTAIGAGGVGGFERAVHGSALIQGAVGSGGVRGTGGFGTRGSGGGRPGYGTMNTVGGSSGYTVPLEEEALVEGGLDKDQIAAVIQRHLGEVLYCYEKGLQVDSSLAGRVGTRFTINASGRVSTAGVENSSLKSSKVEGCILGKLRSWQFPKPLGGVNVKVSYPFVLRRAG